MKNFLLLLIVISLAGCGETKAEQAADNLAAAQKQAIDASNAYLTKFRANPPVITKSK